MNKLLFILQLAALLYCFSQILLPVPLIVLGILALGGLTIYDFYIAETSGAPSATVAALPGGQSALARHYLDEVGATVIASCMLLASVLVNQRSGRWLGSTPFYHGALVFLPLIAMLRLLLRPEPKAEPPFRNSKLSLTEIGRRMYYLNTAFTIVCIYILDKNEQLALSAGLRYQAALWIVTVGIFLLWLRLPQDALARDSDIRTPMKFEEQERNQWAAKILNEISKQDPMYTTFAALNVLFPIVLGAPIAASLWPWLAGKGLHTPLFPLAANVVTFLTVMASWSSIKRLNAELRKLLRE